MAMATSLPREGKPAASTVSALLLALLATGATSIPFPWSPPSLLPSLNGSAFPPFRTVFFQGECTANDDRGAINQNKTCFSCFRIPTVLAGQTPGVLHAFAEARRGELTGGFHQYTGSGDTSCPDGPDTRLAYKRSVDGGAQWSPVKIFLQHRGDPHYRAENGDCQSQAAPFIDPTTKTLFVAFNQGGPMCHGSSRVMLVNSTDDGLSWSAPYAIQGPGLPMKQAAVGPTKGLTVRLPSGGVRLLIPGENSWSASVYSDDHGKTWMSNAGNRTLTLSPGEMDWTVCSGGACAPGAKYAMIHRGGDKSSPTSCGIQFADAMAATWSRETSTKNGETVVGTHHGKPGLVGVPGALISSQQIEQCPLGAKLVIQEVAGAMRNLGCNDTATGKLTPRSPSDVSGHGMGLLISKDGVSWKLYKKLWPFGGMYTTMAGLTFDSDGAALTYGVIFSAGTSFGLSTGTVFWQNFTSPTQEEIDSIFDRE